MQERRFTRRYHLLLSTDDGTNPPQKVGQTFRSTDGSCLPSLLKIARNRKQTIKLLIFSQIRVVPFFETSRQTTKEISERRATIGRFYGTTDALKYFTGKNIPRSTSKFVTSRRFRFQFYALQQDRLKIQILYFVGDKKSKRFWFHIKTYNGNTYRRNIWIYTYTSLIFLI